MKIKKYPQSHLVIFDDNSKIIIDPGSITFASGFFEEEFADAQAYLFTHTHQDHLDLEHVKKVVGDKKVFGNADVVEKLRAIGVGAIEVKDQQNFQAGSFKIVAINLPHCLMADGSAGPPNTGFLINGILFHPGDGDKAPISLKSDNLALPIAGPTISLDGALKFALDVEAKIVIPIHNDYFKNDPYKFLSLAKPANIEVRLLKVGEETTI